MDEGDVWREICKEQVELSKIGESEEARREFDVVGGRLVLQIGDHGLVLYVEVVLLGSWL
jgi:hypothetical protein